MSPRDVASGSPADVRLTWSGEPALESAVDSQVRYLANCLLSEVDIDARFAFLLCGGFGRGEGTARIHDGRLEIQNDYDFELIVDTGGSRFVRLYRTLRKTLDPLADRLAAELGIKQVDIGIKSLSALRRSPRTIARYEMSTAHRLVRGDPSVVARLETFPAREIPLTEGARLLLNRGGGMLIAASYLLRSAQDWTDAERQNFETELSKAILACGDVLLLEKGRYHYSYATRAARLEELDAFRGRPRHARLHDRATRYKLDWTPAFDLDHPNESWVETRDLLLRTWREFETRRLGREFSDWSGYAELVKPRHESILLDLARCLARPDRTRAARGRVVRWLIQGHEASLLSDLPSLLTAFEPTSSGSRSDLASSPPDLVAGHTRWIRATARFLRLWHPEGEAGRTADRLMDDVGAS